MAEQTAAISTSVEMYLKEAYRLSQEQGIITTTSLAKALGVRPASVTGMLRKLVDRGLVRHERYGKIHLTDEGSAVAGTLLRRHYLCTRLLTDVLGMDPATAAERAKFLEHAVDEEVEKRLAFLLGSCRELFGENMSRRPLTMHRPGALFRGDKAAAREVPSK